MQYRCNFPIRFIWPIFILLALGINYGCKNPSDYEPEDEDNRVNPPEPPELLSPADSFVRMPKFGDILLPFSWTSLPNADAYEVKLRGDSFPEWTVQVDTNWMRLQIDLSTMMDKFTWQVRAASPRWNDWTAWSSVRHFEIRYRPPPPLLISPPFETTFYLDSLTAVVNFRWSRVQDEQFYNFRLFLDITTVYNSTVPLNTLTLTLADTGRYTWQVRAGSTH